LIVERKHCMSDFADSESELTGQTRTPRPRPGLEPVPILDAAESVTLQIEILKESYDEMVRVMGENEWDSEEGLRTLLLTGLGYQDARLRLGLIADRNAMGDPSGSEHLDRLVNDLAAYHAMYSVMKFKAFKLYKVNQVLDFNVAGLRATERMWEGWADVMRRRQADLQAEIERLRAQLSEFEIDTRSADDGSEAAGSARSTSTGITFPAASVANASMELRLSSNPSDPSEAPPGAEPRVKLSLPERVRRFFGKT
jgi:hypothetical protein